MKQVMVTVLGLFAAGLSMAQTRQIDFIQRGTATLEMEVDYFTAAHPSLPIGSRVRITNPANDKEVEVTVTGRIPVSADRVIDLSPDTAAALGLEGNSPVIVSLPHQPRPPRRHPRSQEPVVATSLPVAPESAPAAELAAAEVAGAEPLPDTVPAAPVSREPPQPEISEAKPLYNAPSVTIRIIPALPDPTTGKVYQLLVGTYQEVDRAFRVWRQLQSAGFDVAQSQSGDICKIFAANIPASNVFYAAQRLGAIGFLQVWIHE